MQTLDQENLLRKTLLLEPPSKHQEHQEPKAFLPCVSLALADF